ncbi:putative deacetylase [Kurthia zopfii]|uniref:Bifunctional xylanase/deacetylase n=1 Tax=Kurthia zopfii TaxID=1650 RepID=A0A8B4Q884_9BACL|nr:polysaccharide deacetylase family protein [Kurthia zopfii]PWI22405.1 hypothetical protein DF281_07385 [Kurthia zopfii]TDR38465.1 peptidoglycan/xylan/chitin deacetylase (PgdA/CDA1 family) [Kurthia zopfii]GEK30474.1 putative deacetylase [Kurthia zopfii]STX08555.1 Bifunctional xylanase/deacetylase precursor [Kurthia zopfii]
MNQRRPKRRWLIDSLLVCTFLSLVIFAISYIFFMKDTPKDDASASSEHISTADTSDSFVKKVTVTNDTDHGKYRINYPQTNSKKLNDAVNDSINGIKSNFLKNHSQNETLYVNYKVYRHKKLYSFVVSQKVKEGTVFKEKNITTFTVDQQKDELLTLNDIIPSEKHLQNFSDIAQKKLNVVPEVVKFNKTQDHQLKIDSRSANFKNIALSKDTLELYFNPESFNNSFDDVVHLQIPLSDLQAILASNLKDPVKRQKKKKITGKVVALTFDDGPNTTSTQSILNTLKKENVKATFFMVGTQAKANPKMVKKIAAAGHELGNHSLTHANLIHLNPKQLAHEIEETNKAIKKAVGKNPTVFRPPYGSYNPAVAKAAKMPIVLWNVDTLDWQHHNAAKTLANVKAEKTKYTTVLMHDIHQSSADALPAVIKYLKKEGYTFVSSTEMLNIQKNLSK